MPARQPRSGVREQARLHLASPIPLRAKGSLVDIKQIKSDLNSAIADARTITDRAEQAGRSLSDEERGQVERLLAKSKSLNNDIKRANGDAAIRSAIADLGSTAGYTGSGRAAPPRVKALGGTGGWSGAVLGTTNGGIAAKALLPNGQAPISVPLNPEPVRQDEPVLALRQLIPSKPDSVGSWSYMRQTLRDNNAAIVPKGARKPTSLYSLDRVEERSHTIAHLSEPLARQDLDDAAMLGDFLDVEMRLGLELALEDEIVNGSGVGDHFTGLANLSGSHVQLFADDVLSTTRRAITALEIRSLAPTGWVFSPGDWEAIELFGAGPGEYALSAGGAQALPVERASRRLWGLPVAVSTTVEPGAGYLVDFAGSTELRIREEARLDWSENMYRPDAFGAGDGASDFETNRITFRCEGRFGFAVTRPAGVVQVELAEGALTEPAA